MKNLILIMFISFMFLSCATSNIYENILESSILETKFKNHLLGYWSFDEIELLDASRFRNAALNHNAILDQGIIGKSIELSSNNSFIRIQNESQYNSINKTIMFWFNKNTPTINQTYGLKNVEGIIGKANNTGVDREFSISISNDQYPFNIYSNVGVDTGKLITTSGESIIYPQKWYHVALVISQNKIQLYLNGELIKNTTIINKPIINQSDIYIGKSARDFHTTRYFNGKIDELYIFNKTFTQSEIRTFYLVAN